MRRLLAVALVALLTACNGGDAPPVPRSITFTVDSVVFDAIGANTTVAATVNDERGRAMDDQTVTWSLSGSAASFVLTTPGGTNAASHSVRVTSTAGGEALLTAIAGAATSTLHIATKQLAALLSKSAGDNQIAAPNTALSSQLAVRVVDRLNAPIAGVTVVFAVVEGGGSLSAASATTGTDGIARVSWTLGAVGVQHVSASLSGSSLPAIQFAAQATANGVASLIALDGGNEAFPAGSAATPPRLKVVNSNGDAVPGITVNFAVTAGSGSISATSAVSGADGVASLTRWTLGSPGALNEVTAAVVNGPTLTFDDAGCDSSPAAGFSIGLCYRTTMTASQRQAFVSAAAKWSSIITNEVPDVPSGFGTCGGGVPQFKGAIDDLLIFASIEPIDGPSNIVGSAAPCATRQPSGFPILGTMRFDVADMAALESRNLLNAVILHEMGHVLGIGTFWDTRGLLQNRSSTTSSLDTYYNGANGLAGFDAIGGASYTGGNKVPVANVGGSGTINAHWRDSVLVNELMTGTINNGSNPLSLLTVRSLQDLGYTVNTANADPFLLTLAVRFEGATVPDGVALGNDILPIPLISVDAKGHSTRVPR